MLDRPSLEHIYKSIVSCFIPMLASADAISHLVWHQVPNFTLRPHLDHHGPIPGIINNGRGKRAKIRRAGYSKFWVHHYCCTQGYWAQ